MDILEIISKIINEGKCTNTYKMAWAKAIIELVSDASSTESDIEIPFDKISEKFIEYYWDIIAFEKWNQSNNPNAKPLIIKEIELLQDNYNRKYEIEKPILYIELNSKFKDSLIYICAIRNISRILGNDVCYRFIHVNGVDYNELYEYSIKDKKIIVTKESVQKITEYSTYLKGLIRQRWNDLNKEFNKDIYFKTENAKFDILKKKTEEKIEEKIVEIKDEKSIDEDSYEEFDNYNEYSENNYSNLIGILESIDFDSVINEKEIDRLQDWLAKSKIDIESDVYIKIDKILEDKIITEDEKKEIINIIENVKNDGINKIEELKGIIRGIIFDEVVNIEEIKGLKVWLDKNKTLKGMFLYDNLYEEIKNVLEDDNVSEIEEIELKKLLNTILLKESNFYKMNLLRKKVKSKLLIGNDLISLINEDELVQSIHNQAISEMRKVLMNVNNIRLIDTDIIFISLCLIALKSYNGNFYDFVEEQYEELYINNSRQKIAGKIKNIISLYRKNFEKEDTRFINLPIKNAIVPMHFLPSFFEFINDIYELNFNNSLDENDNIEDEFKFVYEGIRKNASEESNTLKVNVSRKTYELIKTTQELILHDEYLSDLIELSGNVIKIIDNYSWNENDYQLENSYYKFGLEKWIEKQSKKKNSKLERKIAKWEPTYQLDNDSIYLIPPVHNIKENYDYSKISIKVTNGNKVLYENNTPVIKEIFGGYRIENPNIKIDRPLNKLRYLVLCGDEVIYDSKEKLNRNVIAFNNDGKEIKNNTDYSGEVIFCYKKAHENIKKFYECEFYLLGNCKVNSGDIIDFEDSLFNFSKEIKPGISGDLQSCQLEIKNKILDIYKSVDKLILESTEEAESLKIVINNKENNLDDFCYVCKKRGIYNVYLIDMKLSDGVYNVSVIEEKGNKTKVKEKFDFAIDSLLEYSLEKIDIEHYIVHIKTSFEKNVIDRNIFTKEEEFYKVLLSNEKYKVVLPLDIIAIRVDDSQWYNEEQYLWLGDINKQSKLTVVGIDFDSVEVTDSSGMRLLTTLTAKRERFVKVVDISTLMSYSESNESIILEFYDKENNIKYSVEGYFKAQIDDRSYFDYDSLSKDFTAEIWYKGLGDLWFEIVDEKIHKSVYEEKITYCGQKIIINNLESFKKYKVSVYEKVKGFTLFPKRILYSEISNIYAYDDFIGRKLKIKSVEYDEFHNNHNIRKSIALKGMYIQVLEKCESYNYLGYIIGVDENGNENVFDELNPVEIEFISNFINDEVDASITNEGDGLLIDLENETIFENLEDPNMPDGFSYAIELEEDEIYE